MSTVTLTGLEFNEEIGLFDLITETVVKEVTPAVVEEVIVVKEETIEPPLPYDLVIKSMDLSNEVTEYDLESLLNILAKRTVVKSDLSLWVASLARVLEIDASTVPSDSAVVDNVDVKHIYTLVLEAKRFAAMNNASINTHAKSFYRMVIRALNK